MITFLRVSIFLATAFFLASADLAAGDEAYPILKYPALTPDEVKQVPFIASIREGFSPPSVTFELHNPFRDKSVAGIVMEISYQKVAGEKPTVFELFAPVDCSPLQSVTAAQPCFDAIEAGKVGATIILKEVHILPEKSSSPAKGKTHAK